MHSHQVKKRVFQEIPKVILQVKFMQVRKDLHTLEPVMYISTLKQKIKLRKIYDAIKTQAKHKCN